MRVIFCGTPQFAVPTLEALLEAGFTIDLAVTNPDEPSGRGYRVRASAVKQAASKAGLQIFQPARLRDPSVQAFMSGFHPEAIVVVAYGHILPGWMIALPRFGCVNLHASLLPKYRGAAPIQWAIIRGELVTGVTTMQIAAGLDTGDILLQQRAEIHDTDTTETLAERLSVVGSRLMVETLHRIERGEIAPQPQDHSQATLAPMLKKEDGKIEWSLAAQEIWHRTRGLRPWPGAYTSFRGLGFHIWSAARVEQMDRGGLKPGCLIREGRRLLVVCGEASLLELQEVQLEGRKRISASEFLNGVQLMPGEALG